MNPRSAINMDRGTGPKAAAGCFIMSRQTGRFLFSFRAHDIASGGTWSLWGGKCEPGETPMQTALREVEEETGYSGAASPLHIHRLEERGFIYDTFLLICECEFCPVQCPESIGYAWMPIEEVPAPMHWGLDRLFSDRRAVSLLGKAVETESGRGCPIRLRAAMIGAE